MSASANPDQQNRGRGENSHFFQYITCDISEAAEEPGYASESCISSQNTVCFSCALRHVARTRGLKNCPQAIHQARSLSTAPLSTLPQNNTPNNTFVS